jgi:hypothetical protein
VTNNTVVANNGSGIVWHTTSPVIRNNLIAYNTWGLELGDTNPSSATISNNYVYGNTLRGQRSDYQGIADQTGLNGNISTNPIMANYKIGNFNRNIASNSTILDGGGVPTVVMIERAGYLVSAVDGFTIQNGGVYTGGVPPGGNDGYGGLGGGIYCQVSSPCIENNTIRRNSLGNPFDNANKLGYGGGIYTYLSSAFFRKNVITENEIINIISGKGGGIYFIHSAPVIEGNTIT